MRTSARLAGWQAFWGAPRPLHAKVTSRTKIWDARPGGVGVLVRSPWAARTVEIAKGDTLGEYLRDTTRWLHVYVSLGTGRTGMNLQVVYGDVRDEAENAKLMDAVLEYTARLGNTPVVIAGDFNLHLDEPRALSPSLADVLCSGELVDLDALHAVTRGVPTQACCMAPGAAHPTRIDGMLTDKCTAAGLRRVVALDTSLPTHKAVLFELTLERAQQEVRKARRLLDLEFTRDLSEDDREAIAHTACNPHLADFTEALAAKDVEEAMRLWSLMAEQTWLQLADPNQTHRGATGRCTSKMHMITTMQPKRHTPCGKPMTQVLAAISAATTGLRPLLTHLRTDSPGVPPLEAVRQWRASLKHQRRALTLDPAISWPPLPDLELLPPPLLEVEGMHRRLKDYVTARLLQDDTDRIKAFRTRQQEAWYGGTDRGIVYKYVKEDTWSSVVFVARPDGSPTADIKEMDELLHAAWDPILRRYAPGSSWTEPEADAFMAKYGRLVRRLRCEMTVRPLTAARLKEQLRRTSVRKATGLDGWAVSNLKRLPPSVLTLLARFLNLVEQTGRWRWRAAWPWRRSPAVRARSAPPSEWPGQHVFPTAAACPPGVGSPP